MHLILVTALAENRRRGCVCGAVALQRYGVCRECPAVAVWHQETRRTRRRAIPTRTHARRMKAWLLARVASLLHLASRKAES
jgi:hypothetical protein